jgi:hypothetical protein
MAATDTHATVEQLLEAMFSVRSALRPYYEGVKRESAGSQLRVAVAEAGKS